MGYMRPIYDGRATSALPPIATESLQKQIEASNFCAVNFRDVSALCYDNGLKRSETLL